MHLLARESSAGDKQLTRAKAAFKEKSEENTAQEFKIVRYEQEVCFVGGEFFFVNSVACFILFIFFWASIVALCL